LEAQIPGLGYVRIGMSFARATSLPGESRSSFRARPAVAASSLMVVTLLLVAAPPVLGAGGMSQTSQPSEPSQPKPASPSAPREMVRGEPSGFRLPFETDQHIFVGQGWNNPYSHNGLSAYAYDFGLPAGTPVVAAAAGVVAFTHTGETTCGGPELLLNANVVTIDHPDFSATQYGHLATIDVEVGDVVEAGQVIGTSGDTGYTGCRPHLHFARQVQGGLVTDSVPIYFQGYEDSQFVSGDRIETLPPPCTTDEKQPVGAFCGTYRGAGVDLAEDVDRPEEVDGGKDLEAPVLFTRLDEAIDFRWKKDAPRGYWLDEASVGFDARWVGQTKVTRESVYTVEVRTTDRVRVLVDGELVIDRWKDHQRARDFAVLVRLEAGRHTIEVEQVNLDGKGVLRLSMKPFLLDAPWRRRAEALLGR
jgi:murein DD-endopeptidase MepM/ murein hydrolase activator NlpD